MNRIAYLICIWITLKQGESNLVCLLGNDAPSATSFDRITTCGSHEVCSLDQYVTPSGLIRYNAVCTDSSHCGGSTVQDPFITVCSQCCSKDICSATLCGNTGFDNSTGPLCYDCDYAVESPEFCDKIKKCSRDQVCSTYKTTSAQYRMGCIEKVQCDLQKQHSECVTCCTGNLCNNNCTATNITIASSCYDDPACGQLLDTFHASNQNLCDDVNLRKFCNDTCGLCPTTTPAPTTVHPCRPNPCQNGVCSLNATTGFHCTCNVGYAGILCDRMDPCYYQPCKNGQCVNLVATGFRCDCNPGFTGLICDSETTPCTGTPCGLNGACTINGSSYVCNCNVGYVGTNCEYQIKDCYAIKQSNIMTSSSGDIYTAIIDKQSLDLRCDMTTARGGWTIIMNRVSGDGVNFVNKDSSDYAVGFGDIRGNFWIGLEKIHALTNDGRRYQLRVEISDAAGNDYYETYDDFSIGPPRNFVLHIGKGSGTAGDSLSGHNGFGFSTEDVDVDSNPTGSCSKYIQGAWWFHNCADSCLTCAYITPGVEDCQSMYWNSYQYCVALRSARMMVRPA